MLKHLGKVAFILLIGFLLLSAPNTSSATISLEFNPSGQTVGLGSPASVDIMVMTPDMLLGAFDFWVNYDSSIISLSSVNWGTGLGTLVSGTDADYSVDDSQTPGSIKLVNLWATWNGTSALDQDPNGFSLLTLNFDSIGIGTSDLWFSDIYEVEDPSYYLSDARADYANGEFGDYINLENVTRGGITVEGATSVPEPGTALLLGLGLAALASLKKRIS